MALFDDLSKRASAAGQRAVQKTKELSEVTRVNGLISDEEKTINNTYFQIGKLYAAIHRFDPEEAFVSMVNTVAAAEEKIKDYRKEIEEIRGIQHCEKCGAEVAKGAAFCSACGASMPRVAVPASGDYVKCTRCGAMVKSGMRFCTSCGTPLGTAQQPTAPAVQSRFAAPVMVPPPGPVQQEQPIPQTAAPISQSGETVKCHNCGAPNENGMRFCTSCGMPLESEQQPAAPIMTPPVPARQEQPMPQTAAPISQNGETVKCRNCGAINEKGMRFCTICGNPLYPEQPSVGTLDQDQLAAPDAEPTVESVPVQIEQQTDSDSMPELTQIPEDKIIDTTEDDSQDGIKCIHCGALVEKGMRFCTECGKPLDTASPVFVSDTETAAPLMAESEENKGKVCPHCGTMLASDMLFCTECGTRL